MAALKTASKLGLVGGSAVVLAQVVAPTAAFANFDCNTLNGDQTCVDVIDGSIPPNVSFKFLSDEFNGTLRFVYHYDDRAGTPTPAEVSPFMNVGSGGEIGWNAVGPKDACRVWVIMQRTDSIAASNYAQHTIQC
jgi:hypothetical protein